MTDISPWINFCLHGLLSIMLTTSSCYAKVDNPVLTSTESTVTLTFGVDADATNYTAYFTQSLFPYDISLEPPYNDTRVSITFSDANSGFNYTVQLYETNASFVEKNVYEGIIATVPLPPINVRVTERGSSYLAIKWDSAIDRPYSTHDISSQKMNSALVQLWRGTAATFFNLTDLDPGSIYDIKVQAVSFYEGGSARGNFSLIISNFTLPTKPINVSAEALNTTHISLTWGQEPNSQQDSYQVQYHIQDPNDVQDVDCLDSPCVFSPEAIAGKTITAIVYATSNGLLSEGAEILCSTEPGMVDSFQAVRGVRSLSIKWSPPSASVVSFYTINITSILDNQTKSHKYQADPDMNFFTFIVDQLLGGSAYRVSIEAKTPHATGKEVVNVFYTSLEPVSGLKAMAINTTAILISWKNPTHSEIEHIGIDVRKTENDTLNLIEDESSTSRVVTELIPGELYHVSVLTKTRLLSSEATNTSVNTKPVMPQLVTSSAKESELTVTVERSVDDGVYDEFNLLLLTEIGKVTENITTTSSASFGDLNPGTAYGLTAFTISGSEQSEPFGTILFTRPRPVRDLVVEVVNGSVIHVEWDVPDLGGYDNFTVTVEEAEDQGSPIQERTTKNTEIEFLTITAGTMYNVTVVTIKGDQRSSKVMEQNTTAPINVKDIRVWVRGVKSVTLVWDPPVASALDGYALTFAPTNLSLSELTSNLTQYKLEDLQPDTDYTIEIFTFALRPDGVKLFSPARQFNFTTYPESVAAIQKVEATSDSITVNWTAPVGGDFNLYQLGLREDSSNPQMFPFLVPRARTNNTFEKLKAGQMYTIAIRTVLQLPRQPPRFGISVRLRAVTKPLPVTDLKVTPVNTSAVTVMWTVNQTSLQNSFLISYGPGSTSTKTLAMDTLNSTQDYELTIGQLLSGTEHVFEVLAIRTIGTDSEESESAIEQGFTVPMPITNLTIMAEDTTLKLSWERPMEGNWDGYQISYQPLLRSFDAEEGAVQKMTAVKGSMGVEIPNLFPGQQYQVNVSAVSHDLFSDELSGRKILDPLRPQDVSQDKEKLTTVSVNIRWTYNAQTYLVEKWEISRHVEGSGAVLLFEKATGKSEYSVTLPDLIPGHSYLIKVTSLVLTARSPPVELPVTAKPVINTEFEEISTTNTSLQLTYTIRSVDIFQSLIFSINGQEGSSMTKQKVDINREVMFDNLQAGTQYTVSAVTVSGEERSSPFLWDFITYPNPVRVDLLATANMITLTFEVQLGNIAEHVVSCTPVEAGMAQCPDQPQTVRAGDTSVILSGLRPFTEYSFEVTTRTEIVRGKAKEALMSYKKKTAEAAPSKVRGLTISEAQLHSVLLSWQPPSEVNGLLRSYIVSYRGKEPNVIEATVDQNIQTVSATLTSLKLDNLKAGYEYRIEVFAKTVADGLKVSSTVILPTADPAFQMGQTAESSAPVTPASKPLITRTKLSVQFTNPFSNDRGYLSYYTVIVSKDPKADDSTATLPSWSDARKDRSIKVYQALGKCEDFFTQNSGCGVGTAGSSTARKRRAVNSLLTRVFILGDQTEQECQGVEFCNGALEEDTEYYVKLRGFTSSGKYSETAFSTAIKTDKESASNGGLIGGVVTAVSVLLAIVVGVIIFQHRRHKPKRATKHTASNSNWEQASLNKFSRVVKLVHFADHIRKMNADSDFKYAEEYEDLKEVGRGQPTLASEFPPNRPKNRFTNILPYDHSRVKLLPTDDEEGSDYINANYMPGYSSKREYIATQGPLPATRDDFWRMLWEQGSRNIVMLTKCQEKGREKSDHYWPTDMEPKYYGDLQVVILAETPMPDWTVSELKVSLGEQSRNVRHFHYRSWPDFGVPKDPTSLIRFVRTVRERLISEGSPIITHCSAGVGRSGTFIILDHLFQLIREKDEVDIFSMVYKLRKERVLMVQTERFRPRLELQEYFSLQQYKFIHECLLCVLENREDDTTYANVGQINIGYEGD